jgi:hypothetical protein
VSGINTKHSVTAPLSYDILPTDCVIEQLKYKSETTAAAA